MPGRTHTSISSYLRSSLFQWPDQVHPLLSLTAPCRYLICLRCAYQVRDWERWQSHYDHEFEVLCSKLNSTNLDAIAKSNLKALFQTWQQTPLRNDAPHIKAYHACCDLLNHIGQNDDDDSALALIMHTLLLLQLPTLDAAEQHSARALCDQLLPKVTKHLGEVSNSASESLSLKSASPIAIERHYKRLVLCALAVGLLWVVLSVGLSHLPALHWAFVSAPSLLGGW